MPQSTCLTSSTSNGCAGNVKSVFPCALPHYSVKLHAPFPNLVIRWDAPRPTAHRYQVMKWWMARWSCSWSLCSFFSSAFFERAMKKHLWIERKHFFKEKLKTPAALPQYFLSTKSPRITRRWPGGFFFLQTSSFAIPKNDPLTVFIKVMIPENMQKK